MSKLSLIAASLMLVSAQGSASEPPPYDVMCRLKAKEVAAEAYRGCLTEARATQIDQLKRDYQDRLKAMKSEYEQELKRLGVSPKVSASASAAGSSKKLPKKPGSKSSLQGSSEMAVGLRPASGSMPDESVMELPEPTPIEDVPSVASPN